MVICFYADLYWILNFTMNLFLLYITAWWLHEPANNRRWVLSAAVCAIFPVIVTYINNCGLKVPGLISSASELALLLWWAYRPGSIREFFNCIVSFIVFSALAAGMVFMLKGVSAKSGILPEMEGNQKFSLFFLLVSVFMLFIIFRFLRASIARQDLKRRSVVNATLVHNGMKKEIKALYDTGNHLVSPYTGEPVAVISKDLSDCIGLPGNHAPLLIPYHSIGGCGLLEAYRLDILQFQDGSSRKGFLAAVSDNICTDKEIQMILTSSGKP